MLRNTNNHNCTRTKLVYVDIAKKVVRYEACLCYEIGTEGHKLLERVSKIDSASHQALTCKAGYRLSFCHEDPAEAVDQRAVGTD